MRVAHAIVRLPGANFGDGITSAPLGAPDYAAARRQHDAYCDALRTAGAEVTVLDADRSHPDAHFVEDAAVMMAGVAILTRPGAIARREEAAAMRAPLARFFDAIETIDAPATLDGGDVCEADERIYIGISQRTNAAGAEQLARIAARLGKEPVVVDVRGVPAALHLKSAMAYAGDGTYVVSDALLPLISISQARVIRVAPGEEYGANCVRVNDAVLIPAEHPRLRDELERAGYDTVSLDVSEFRKMDGGLSCLSLRF